MEESKEKLIDKISTIVLVVVLILVPLITIPTIPCDLPRMIILLSCGLALLILIPFKMRKIKIDRTDICIIVFAIWALLSAILSSRREISLLGTKTRFEGILMIMIYILIYFHSKYSFIKFKKLENVLIVEYIAICFLGIIQFYLPDSLNIPLISGMPMGTFGNTNFMGSFISLVLPVFMFNYVTTGKTKFIFGSAIAFSAMIMCVARSSWVAFAACIVGLIIYLIVKKDKFRVKKFTILILTFALCFTFIEISSLDNKWVNNKFDVAVNEIQSIVNDGINSKMGSGRIKIWKMTIEVIAKKPILGCGIDNLYFGMAECVPEMLIESIMKSKAIVDKAHNEYLQIAATMGIPALIAYIGFVGSIMTQNFKKCFKEDKNMLYVLVIGSYITQAFFNISVIGIAPVFWFVLGMAAREVKKQ